MASVVAMSDEEIRRKLKEHNINIPLTDSTRKILIEKITKLAENKKSPGRSQQTSKPSRRTISHFSSGEDETESEDDSRSKKKTKMPPPSAVSTQRSTRRQTIGVPSPKPEPVVEPSRRSTAFRSPVASPPLRVDVKRSSGRFSTQTTGSVISPNVTMRRPRTQNADEYDKGSDSDTPLPTTLPRTLPRLADLNKLAMDKEVNDIMKGSSFLNRLNTVTSYLKGDGDSDDAASRDVLMSYRKPAISPDNSPSAFVSDFTRSISRRQPSASFTSHPNKTYLDSSGSEDLSPSSSRTINGSFASGGEDGSDAAWTNTHLVSMILVIVAVVFFVALGVFYVNMHGTEVLSYDSANTRNKIPFCSNPENPADMCVTSEQLKAATRLLHLLKPELERRAVAEVCGPPLRDGTYVSAVMTEKALTDWLKDRHDIRAETSTKDLRSLRLLLLRNAHWGVGVRSALPGTDDEAMLLDAGSLVVPSVSLPLSCHVKRKLAAILTAVATIAAVLAGVIATRRGSAWWLARRESQRQRVYGLVQRILEALRKASESGAQYVAINHIRDQLIAPQHRDGLGHLNKQTQVDLPLLDQPAYSMRSKRPIKTEPKVVVDIPRPKRSSKPIRIVSKLTRTSSKPRSKHLEGFVKDFVTSTNHKSMSTSFKADEKMLKNCSEKVKLFYETYVRISEEEALSLCLETVSQTGDVWKGRRKPRITGSKCYELFTFSTDRKTTADWNNKLERLLFSSFRGNAFTRFGLENEGSGIGAYERRSGRRVERLGMLVNRSAPWIGYSPDGIALEDGRLIEVKCPDVGRTLSGLELARNYSALEVSDSAVRLKKRHVYYGQVQCGMLVTGLRVADFVVYSAVRDDCLIIEVPFDHEFVHEMVQRLRNTYFNIMLPFLTENQQDLPLDV